jgi:hypothetical protein
MQKPLGYDQRNGSGSIWARPEDDVTIFSRGGPRARGMILEKGLNARIGIIAGATILGSA